MVMNMAGFVALLRLLSIFGCSRTRPALGSRGMLNVVVGKVVEVSCGIR